MIVVVAAVRYVLEALVPDVEGIMGLDESNFSIAVVMAHKVVSMVDGVAIPIPPTSGFAA